MAVARRMGMVERTAFWILLAIIVLAVHASAAAQQRAEQMTCEQLIASFERKGVIYKMVHGQVLALKAGVPIRKTQGLQCGPNNYTLQRASARTIDKRSCVYAIVCEGKANSSVLKHN